MYDCNLGSFYQALVVIQKGSYELLTIILRGKSFINNKIITSKAGCNFYLKMIVTYFVNTHINLDEKHEGGIHLTS